MTLKEALEQKVPPASLDYCVKLWEETPFHFKVARTRSTCLGNYRFYRKQHYISVNHDLNTYNFLITYIHEVAHLRVQLSKANVRKVLPHGEEWKAMFSRLLKPMQSLAVFPEDILGPLNAHMINPKASSTRDADLLTALKKYNNKPSFTLAQVENGQVFQFKNMVYVKLGKKRTRALVKDYHSERKYTLSLLAEVKLISSDVFSEDISSSPDSPMTSPKASFTRSSDPLTTLVDKPLFTLAQVENGQVFKFKNALYVKLNNRRTRALAKDLLSDEEYTIPLLAEVALVPLDNI